MHHVQTSSLEKAFTCVREPLLCSALFCTTKLLQRSLKAMKTYLNPISVIIGLAGIPTSAEVPLNRAVRQ